MKSTILQLLQAANPNAYFDEFSDAFKKVESLMALLLLERNYGNVYISNKVEVNGNITINGDLCCDALIVDGETTVKGSVDCDDIKANGNLIVGQNVCAEDVYCNEYIVGKDNACRIIRLK